jgi:hypothetical protein
VRYLDPVAPTRAVPRLGRNRSDVRVSVYGEVEGLRLIGGAHARRLQAGRLIVCIVAKAKIFDEALIRRKNRRVRDDFSGLVCSITVTAPWSGREVNLVYLANSLLTQVRYMTIWLGFRTSDEIDKNSEHLF